MHRFATTSSLVWLCLVSDPVSAMPALAQPAPVSLAGDTARCMAAHGTLLVATVVRNQGFFPGGRKKGVSLSHTHLIVSADGDGTEYQVSIDNVFASDYIESSQKIPNSLRAIKPGDHLEICGITYSNPTGIHYVHTNCGATPAPDQADGWIKEIDSSGNTAASLESSQRYCSLFH